MARQSDDGRSERGVVVTTTLLLLATIALAGLVCLALVAWFGRMS